MAVVAYHHTLALSVANYKECTHVALKIYEFILIDKPKNERHYNAELKACLKPMKQCHSFITSFLYNAQTLRKGIELSI